MTRAAARFARLGLAILLTACTEDLTAPGACPDFCPSTSLTMTDTVLHTAITQDSSYGRPSGYVSPSGAAELVAAELPGLRTSRPIFRTAPIQTRMVIGPDTTTGPVIGVDSLRLVLTITRRDTATHNLRLSLYKLPLAIDSSTAFHDLDGSFAAAPVRTINVDTLLARSGLKDPVTGDTAFVDATNNRVTLFLKLDSAQAPLVLADSGKVAFGIRVSADTLASVALSATENAVLGPFMRWYFKVDSLGLKVVHPVAQVRYAAFDSFVYDPPSAPLGGTLVVGGVPAARTVLRIALPKVIRDSSRVIRATLEFVPSAPLQGIAADSFKVVASPVIADFGAKSPLDGAHVDTTSFAIAPLDTARIDVTDVLRFWTTSPTSTTTLVLRQGGEGANFAELRLHHVGDVGYQATLHVTYAPRYLLGTP